MNKVFKMTLGILATLSFLLVPSSSYAGDLTLKVEPGVAVSTSTPQASRFNAGADLSVKALYGLTPYLDIGPTVSLLVLTSDLSGTNAGTAFGLGGGLRLKRPHDASNKGTGFSAVSPWVDGDLQYIRTGELDRSGLSLGAGASVPTSETRSLWVGPFARYQDVVQTPKVGFDSTDAHVFIVGLSLEFGPKLVKKVEQVPEPKKKVELADRDHDGTPDVTDRCPDVPGPKENQGCPYPVVTPVPTPPPAATLELKQRVQFAWDSSKIQSTQHTMLDEVTKSLLANTNYIARIEGHASSEGQVEHNNVLAQKRADAVVAYLVSKGVSKDRLSATGFGSSQPVATNDTKAGREANRRVEFVVTVVIVKGGN